MHLAGDIGGTKTLLGLFTPDRGPRHPVELAALASRDFRSAGALLGQFLDGRKIDGATFGVAGAVLNDGAWGPNLPWKIVRTELRRALGGTPVRLLNDLEAIATFVPELESGDLVVLAEGVPTEHGPIGVIAPGTGIGQAMLLWGRGGYRAVASEAGHVDFASNTALQDDYLAFLRAFAYDLTRPVDKDQREHVEYVPSQVVTEYFRFRFRDHGGHPVCGILYPSAALDGGRSCVLFAGHEDFTDDWTFGRPSPLPLELLQDRIIRRAVDTSVPADA